MATPISPSPVSDYRPEFLPAYVGNGVVGLRVPRVPQHDGLAILNGFAGIDGESGAEGFARVPYPLAGDLELNGVSLKSAPERAQLREQSYDFGRGELRTVSDFDAGDVRAKLDVLTFCSRTMPMLVLQEVHVSVSRACDAVLTAGVDTTGVPGTLKARSTRTRGTEQQPVDGSLRWESNGAVGLAGVAYGNLGQSGSRVTPPSNSLVAGVAGACKQAGQRQSCATRLTPREAVASHLPDCGCLSARKPTRMDREASSR